MLANRLTEDPALKVLVIEAGADQKDDPRVNVPGMWSALAKTSSDWAFTTTPQVRSHNLNKAIGLINSLIFQ